MKLLFLLLLIPSISFAGPTVIIDGKITWTGVTEYIDNTPISDPVTYNIYCDPNGNYKTPTGGYITPTKTGIADTFYPLIDLGLSGSQACSVTATSGTGESYFSNSVNFMCQGQCISGHGPKSPVADVAP